jgi:antitoxin MazE
MRVSKWGDSLAIRLPAGVVEEHKLKEGDEIEVSIAGKRDFKTARDRNREKAIESLRRLARPLPPGFKFDREEVNER